ncbi:MAG: lysophospholipid acyltransferase family protein, partial [Candidatus Rokubacteria bacterium]|nr:lysophospholipid acyltransferase family protein [Candidatus Rokubacteria bacterium]
AWQHLGLTFVEMCALVARPVDRFLERVTLDGVEHLKGAMASPGRALLLTAHLGNWELLPAASRLTGYPLAVVVRPLESFGLNALAERVRRRTGVELIDKRRALRPVLAALARGRMVGILLDQNAARREGVFVPLFGRRASTSRSIAVLAIRTGTPVLPVFTRRESGGLHRVVILPPLSAPAAQEAEEAIVELTARCTAAIEAAIRATPAQWLWIHDRWRTRPPEDA